MTEEAEADGPQAVPAVSVVGPGGGERIAMSRYATEPATGLD
ncbi:hypothetical protein ABZY57_17100 [Streptomyces sp. NPDC006450]